MKKERPYLTLIVLLGAGHALLTALMRFVAPSWSSGTAMILVTWAALDILGGCLLIKLARWTRMHPIWFAIAFATVSFIPDIIAITALNRSAGFLNKGLREGVEFAMSMWFGRFCVFWLATEIPADAST